MRKSRSCWNDVLKEKANSRGCFQGESSRSLFQPRLSPVSAFPNKLQQIIIPRLSSFSTPSKANSGSLVRLELVRQRSWIILPLLSLRDDIAKLESA